jgi:hypothetical protein
LISAAPGKKTSALHVASQQVEQMVKTKMQTPEYIILCLEDSSDWSNATTRRLVMSARCALLYICTDFTPCKLLDRFSSYCVQALGAGASILSVIVRACARAGIRYGP